MKFEVKVWKIGGSHVITVPSLLMKNNHINEGENITVDFEINGEKRGDNDVNNKCEV